MDDTSHYTKDQKIKFLKSNQESFNIRDVELIGQHDRNINCSQQQIWIELRINKNLGFRDFKILEIKSLKLYVCRHVLMRVSQILDQILKRRSEMIGKGK